MTGKIMYLLGEGLIRMREVLILLRHLIETSLHRTKAIEKLLIATRGQVDPLRGGGDLRRRPQHLLRQGAGGPERRVGR